ncbi:PA2778 family cysteine peptidase [Pelomonas cellulosilytica]|uniref:PA2778 family cysteine peptidase n=1 Tax=Pelomonas cellulosilytica TaxID=2906762 RepID=A0ABS8XUD3_9BURK|nr:PA2778 family cysteine peptidase [Pelomonas sp. P8]MCE4554905.1 PA2778 family cysteine peptidase [Pelomonas sp. P8]
MIPRATAALAALLLSGCASFFTPPQTAALLARPPQDLPEQIERRGVPFFPQTRDHCGPAALATALADAGLPADTERLAEAIFLPARGGSLQLEMLAGARRQGGVATRLPPQLQALLREVAAGHAVVVLQNLGLDFLPRWHYAVVVGYDIGRRELVLRSGTTERELLPLRTFEYTWARAGRWAMAVLQPDRLPATATEADAQDAALGFERSAPPAQAALAYRTLLARWPGNLLAGIGLGNALNTAGDAAGARAAFEAVAERHDSAVAWINLARLRLDAGDRAGARAAAERAIRRADAAEPRWRDAAHAALASTATGP